MARELKDIINEPNEDSRKSFEEETLDRVLKEERPLHNAITYVVGASALLTGTLSVVNAYQGNSREAIVFGIGSAVLGVLGFGAHKLYTYLYN